MIEFKLNPPSGYADSCLDIEFSILTDYADILNIELFNDTSEEKLDILSVSRGFISRSHLAIVKNTDHVEGYINLFNKDKMNKKLKNQVKVNVRCKVTRRLGSDTTTEEAVVLFYNESRSLDAGLVPFDLIIDNSEVDIRNGIPLSLHLICDSTKKYELAILSEGGDEKYTFEIVAKEGRTSFVIPSHILWYDLELNKNLGKKFQIYWVQFEGIDYMKFMNRKYIPIANSQITFNSRKISLNPQKRDGPMGPLSDEFVLSHRYFVHTWKQFSSFGDRIEAYKPKEAGKKNQFLHEIQDFSQKNKQVALMQDKEKPTKRPPMRDLASASQKTILNAYSASFSKYRPIENADRNFVRLANVTPLPAKAPKKGCGGCSRKRNA
jgi:hypothetical protein